MIRGYNNTSSDPSSNSTTRAMGRSENPEGKAGSLIGCATNRFAPWLGGQRPNSENAAREPLGREYYSLIEPRGCGSMTISTIARNLEHRAPDSADLLLQDWRSKITAVEREF